MAENQSSTNHEEGQPSALEALCIRDTIALKMQQEYKRELAEFEQDDEPLDTEGKAILQTFVDTNLLVMPSIIAYKRKDAIPDDSEDGTYLISSKQERVLRSLVVTPTDIYLSLDSDYIVPGVAQRINSYGTLQRAFQLYEIVQKECEREGLQLIFHSALPEDQQEDYELHDKFLVGVSKEQFREKANAVFDVYFLTEKLLHTPNMGERLPTMEEVSLVANDPWDSED